MIQYNKSYYKFPFHSFVFQKDMIDKKYPPKYIIQLAGQLRKNMTPAEIILWEIIRDKKISGYKFRNQHPVDRYILDFYCHEKKLAIEIDGKIHDQGKDYDNYRDEYLKSAGIEVLRFSNDEIINNTDKIIEIIRTRLNVKPVL